MKILLHSSKTMKPVGFDEHLMTKPRFSREATILHGLLSQMTTIEIAKLMSIREVLAQKVKEQINHWSESPVSPAALIFRGDIYSGLSAVQWTEQDMQFAQDHLVIMSGLYGLLRPLDGIQPYRLEMGYKLQVAPDTTLTKFWQKQLKDALDPQDTYINLTAYEYYKAIESSLLQANVIAPKFLTVSPKTHEPVFVTVHAKIARGSFASWLVRHRITNPSEIIAYKELNYRYNEHLSTPEQPVFVCDHFGGLGLSVRLA